MNNKECITWLKVIKVEILAFNEISANKKAQALDKAIKTIEKLEELNKRGGQ